MIVTAFIIKNCQRHNGPEGWVLVTKVTSLGHFTSFRISTKNNLHNLNQGSAAKYWPNFSFKFSPELQLQNLDQSMCWNSEQKLRHVWSTAKKLQNLAWANFSFQICILSKPNDGPLFIQSNIPASQFDPGVSGNDIWEFRKSPKNFQKNWSK